MEAMFKFSQLNAKYERKDLPEGDPFCRDFTHLKSSDYKHVYEPSEDSFLLIDSLVLETKFLKEELKP